MPVENSQTPIKATSMGWRVEAAVHRWPSTLLTNLLCFRKFGIHLARALQSTKLLDVCQIVRTRSTKGP